jgi:predicted DNA-binding transcriptional regulator YafY
LERKRLVADRFRRIWSIVECISHEPGLDRAELAQRFALSERQLQSDLNVIRADIGLPLRRERGYRFVGGSDGSDGLNLADALTLCQLVRDGWRDGSVPKESLVVLTAKLAESFPPPLRPLMRCALCADGTDGGGLSPDMLLVLASAMARHQPVRLHFSLSAGAGFPAEPIVDPEVLLPYGESWYVIGHCRQRQRVMMICLDTLDAISIEGQAAQAS